MKIDLNIDTSKMTKEELLVAQRRIQEALDRVKHQLNTVSIAGHRHLGCVGSDSFFGIPFYLESMTKEELQSVQKEARHLAANFQRQLNPSIRKDDLSKKFFGRLFNFSMLSKEELLEGRKETRALLKKITEQLMIVEKLEGLSRHEDSTKI